MRTQRSTLPTLVLSAALMSACHHTPDSLQLQLVWTPTDDPRDFSAAAQAAFGGQSVAIAVTDARSNAARIGENHEDSTPKPVMTSDSVVAYVGQNMANVLQSNGVRVVASGATRTVRLQLNEFFVSEGNSYQGNVAISGTVEDESGRPVWQGTARGSSERHGRSFTEENYQQTFSDATLDALRQLVRAMAPAAPVAAVAPPGAAAPLLAIPADALQVALQWRPTDDPHDFPGFALNALSGQTVEIAVNDERPNPAAIGENREHGSRPVVTSDSVAAYVGQNVANVLAMNGIHIVPGGATRVVTFAVGEFFVTEENTYQGSVTLRATLTNGSGKPLWQGVVRGTSRRFGRSLNPENYQETLADATLDAMRALIRDLGFQAAARSAD